MVEIKNGAFFANGEKINIYSGAIHYFRTLPEYWEDRLTKLKLAGFNTVETYVCWNLHEPKKGEFSFEGLLDIVEFVKTAQRLGLYAIVRPGPYICAEWDFGGFPAWLLKDENIRLRCCDEAYLGHVRDFYQALLPLLTPLQITRGGNIIAMQVENEYGSYANDKKYLAYLKDLMVSCGVDVLLFTSDGESKTMLSGGTLPELYKVINFSRNPKENFQYLDSIQPDKPRMCGEFWCGWFDHWGGGHNTREPQSVKNVLDEFLELDASINFYMFHGGTNFNFWAGANYHEHYAPTITSYDYDALLNEHGGYTEKYHLVREALHKKQNLPLLPLPGEPSLQKLGPIALTEAAPLFENIKHIGTHFEDAVPHYMEHYGQNFGYILYHTDMKGDYSPSTLTIEDIHDIAYIYINGEFKGKYDRRKAAKAKKSLPAQSFAVELPEFSGTCSVDILVEGMGRVNYGLKLYDRKGVGRVRLWQQIVCGWDVYTLPMEDLQSLVFSGSQQRHDFPLFLKGSFCTSSNADCYVDMRGFTKGCVFVNGFHLGRYWSVGPQRSLYLPGALLKTDGENEIIVFEQEGCKKHEIKLIDKQLLS